MTLVAFILFTAIWTVVSVALTVWLKVTGLIGYWRTQDKEGSKS